MNGKSKKDVVAGIIAIICAGIITWLSLQMKASAYSGDPGPKMFPMIGAALMFICGLLLIIKPGPEDKKFLTGTQWKDAGIIFLCYIAFVVLLHFFGFGVAAPVVLFVLTYLMSALSMPDATKKKRVITSLIYAILAGAAVYVCYVLLLKARLPKGVFWKLF
ncbi:MAG: tripartite tricarboxylate transporter TctB family protein [Clostridia bacterium]|nr:tripartite tricarboxylate transporter TctB family protein [Clostridia bacterium]